MTIRVAINGYGRIGRNILRALYESKRNDRIKIVAINNLCPLKDNVHLTRYDSTHGRFNAEVTTEGDDMCVNGDLIRMYQIKDPAQLPWKERDVDIVYECTGFFTAREKAELHLKAGAKKVLLSAPGKNADATIVYGVNHDTVRPEDKIISNASCTTNCLAPLAKVLHDAVGIETGLMVTVHAFTNDQVLIDRPHIDLHRARAATQSIIPTKTGAATAVGIVLPELNGKLDGYSLRIPTINVSAVDFTFTPVRTTSVAEIDTVLKDAAKGALEGILAVNSEPLVSIDFNHCPASAVYDASQTRMLGNLVKIYAWYDNEWGFSNRMLDVTDVIMRK